MKISIMFANNNSGVKRLKEEKLNREILKIVSILEKTMPIKKLKKEISPSITTH